MEYDEDLLVQRAQAGEIVAFRELVERYKQKLYYFAFDLTNNHHDAEDLAQEVFIKAYRSLGTFRRESRLSSWLYRIAVNTHLNKRRKKTLVLMDLQENLDNDRIDHNPFWRQSNENPENSAEWQLLQRHIDRALRRLSPTERSVFVLRHYHDLPLKEIAQVLDKAEGTVKSLLFRAIKRLQKELAFYRQDLGLEDIR